MALGAELEMIPVLAANGNRVLARGSRPSGEELVSAMGREYGWTEVPMGGDPSSWKFQDGRVTFEPGGQIELSSAVFPTALSLIDSLDTWLARFFARAEQVGVTLKTVGVEELVPIERIPLQLGRERYRMMTSYFESLSPFGGLMMRQTASLQINVDRGESPVARWKLLNALAPYLVAIFANSPRYANSHTGHKSYRAHIWRNLDPSRTGIVYHSVGVAERYLEFALNAPMILGGNGNVFPTFREMLAKGAATKGAWETHLSTLFPEIRPREYFEIRSIDSIAPKYLCAAIAFVAGIVYDQNAASRAIALTGEPDSDLLVVAGVRGLGDGSLRGIAEQLASLAIEGCRALGSSYIADHQVAQAAEFFGALTFRGLSPGDA